ncbi:MAG: hypothetical protein Q9160_002606 [Pyrenula sp. 1 TL-2023]
MELTIFEPEVYNAISGPGSKCIKSDWYDMLHPMVALNSIREKAGYAPRRKMWDEALQSAVRTDEAAILRHAHQLCAYIESQNGCPVVVSDWFNYYSTDVLGEIGFGQDFQMVEKGRVHHIVQLLLDGMSLLGLVTPAPWLAQLLFMIPQATSAWNKMHAWSKQNIDSRMQVDTTDRNITSWFLQAKRQSNGIYDFEALYGDVFALMIAGSHTVSTTLVFLFYELCRNVAIHDKLRSEIDALSATWEIADLEQLPYLRACIDETLRLHAVLPTGGIRKTTDDGIHVAGRYIPPHTTIVAPRYSISRLESCFEQATEFVPERWTEGPEMVRDRSAFVPFNIGTYLLFHQKPGPYVI